MIATGMAIIKNPRLPKVGRTANAILGFMVHQGGGDANQIVSDLHFPGREDTHLTPIRLVPILRRLAEEGLIKRDEPPHPGLKEKAREDPTWEFYRF